MGKVEVGVKVGVGVEVVVGVGVKVGVEVVVGVGAKKLNNQAGLSKLKSI